MEENRLRCLTSFQSSKQSSFREIWCSCWRNLNSLNCHHHKNKLINHSPHFALSPILTLRDVTEVSTTAITDTNPSEDRHEVQICALPQLQTDLCCFMDALIKAEYETHNKYVCIRHRPEVVVLTGIVFQII